MIDKTPRVGRFLVKKASSISAVDYFMPGGKITKISGMRVYYQPIDWRETFTNEFAAICDTEEEYKKLLQWSDQAKARLDELVTALTKEKEVFLGTEKPATRKKARRICFSGRGSI